MSVVLTEDEARMLFEADWVCFSEGIGPDLKPILLRALEAFPGLRGDQYVEMVTKQWERDDQRR